MEPWMAGTEWPNLGCGSYRSEYECVRGLGQSKANSAFQAHWGWWITDKDLATLPSYVINTIRVPVGYWMDESLVYSDSEYFSRGGLPYVEKLCNWAANHGLYIIIELHGALRGQVT